MPAEPLISIVVCVKNGMPYLPQALESLGAQTYKNFEVIVQDGNSNDGSLDVLRAFKDVVPLDIVSTPDAGVGQAYSRALGRCRGEIIGSLDADNVLEPHALLIAAGIFRRQPQAAAAYGSVRIIDAGGNLLRKFEPAPFDVLRLLACELVPPFSTSFFSRRVCGDELYFDERLKTCADFDLWIRISHLPIIALSETLGRTRVSEKSMTCRPETYDQFCADKIAALERYLERFGDGPLFQSIGNYAIAGIYLWAAESLCEVEGNHEALHRFLDNARSRHPYSSRLRELESRLSVSPACAERVHRQT